MSLAWVWFLIAVAAFTWASWLHVLLADANAEVARLDWDNAELRTDIDAPNCPELALDWSQPVEWDDAALDRIRDAVLEQAADDKAHIEQWDKELES